MKKEEEDEEKKVKFISYKKLLIFGGKNSGKTSLSKSFDEMKSTKDKDEIENSNINNKYIILV